MEFVPNRDPSIVLDHIRVNSGRSLPDIRPCNPHTHVMSIAGGGPSLQDTKDDLNGYICAINGSLGYLLDHGITPNACGILDPSEHIIDNLVAHPDVHYYVAASAHPKVFEKLKDCYVIRWYASGDPGVEQLLREIRPDDWFMVGGGSTMGCRWLNLGYVLGFRRFEVHGLDSSYRNGRTHAYDDHERPDRITIEGYETSPNFIQQVSDYGATLDRFSQSDMDDTIINLHGEGLLQHAYPHSFSKPR